MTTIRREHACYPQTTWGGRYALIQGTYMRPSSGLYVAWAKTVGVDVPRPKVCADSRSRHSWQRLETRDLGNTMYIILFSTHVYSVYFSTVLLCSSRTVHYSLYYCNYCTAFLPLLRKRFIILLFYLMNAPNCLLEQTVIPSSVHPYCTDTGCKQQCFLWCHDMNIVLMVRWHNAIWVF